MAEWRRCPPVHQLVAAFMGYRGDDQPVRASAQDDGAPWVPPGMAIPASADLAAATTTTEALKAAERMFFGDITDGIQL